MRPEDLLRGVSLHAPATGKGSFSWSTFACAFPYHDPMITGKGTMRRSQKILITAASAIIAITALPALPTAATADPAPPNSPAATPSQMPSGTPDEVEITTGFTTDPKWVNNPGSIVSELKKGKTFAQLGLDTSTPKKITPVTPQQSQKLAKSSGQSYTAKADDYDQPTLAAPPYDYISLEECRANTELSGRPEGWIKNHFAYCAMGVTFAGARIRWGPIWWPAGSVEARVTLIGYGKAEPRPGSTTDRFVDFKMFIDQVKPDGRWWRPDSTLEVEMECGGWPTASACQVGRNGREAPVTEWMDNGEAEFELFSPAAPADASAGEQKAIGVFRPTFDWEMPGARISPDEAKGSESGVRFDSAWYLPRKQGAIFDRTNPRIDFALDSEYRENTEHVDQALHRPGETKPFKEGKKLPGGSPENPLHRLYQGISPEHATRYNRNNTIARATCDREFPGWNSEPGKLQCDEYPFRSTYEGAARDEYEGGDEHKYLNDFSVKPILSDHNSKAGTRLGVWYGADRILNGDHFFVRITP
ncbi:hypothetical protein [Nonomuraea sp. NPDC049400]|uniref:NucA/NucB deoxyribonuclease domain-containing protein n=1 Tax=Nonomuraea sp. NPDC049400 TaxID=3364352 RepID=UPI0037BD148D